MPLYKTEQINDSSGMGIWEITESFDVLANALGKPVPSEIKNEKRKSEWLVTRLLIRHITRLDFDILYDENGKPFLKDSDFHISISHTKQFVAVFISKEDIPGIDIEIIHPRIEKISSRFLSENEKAYLQNENLLEQLYVIWGAKECAFKIYSKGGVEFKSMLHVKQFAWSDKGKTSVMLKKDNTTCEYPVWWKRIGELMVVFSFYKNL